MSETITTRSQKETKTTGQKCPELLLLATKQFPQDFFGEECQINQRNSRRYSSSKIREHKGEQLKRLEKGNHLYAQTETNCDFIQEVIVEPEIRESFNEVYHSHRQRNEKIKDLEFLNDNDEPSTSGSNQGFNPLSNANSPNYPDQLSPIYFCLNQNDNANCDAHLFKETAHFFRCETEIKEHEPKHSSVRSELPKSSRLSKAKPATPKTRNAGKGNRTPNRDNSPITPEKSSKTCQKSELRKRPQSVLGGARPLTLIKTQQVFTRELVDLMDNVPKEYIADPEIKKGLNLLLKNLNDFKKAINNKKNITESKREKEGKPINSYKRAINKKSSNIPIKIINQKRR